MATVADSETAVTTPDGADLAAEERALKHEEFAARREEARVKLRATAAPWWRGADPLVLAVVAGVLTLGGNTFLAYYNAKATIAQEKTKAENALRQEEKKAADDLELEKEKAKATLILQAVSTNDPATARRNLLFFLDGGLIKDDDQKIHQALDKYAPVLPSSSGQASRLPPASPAGYDDVFWNAAVRPEWVPQLDRLLAKMIDGKSRLEHLAQAVHTPWYFIGVLWLFETGGDFSRHLHNGDPLIQRTTHIPTGRPQDWPPPAGVDAWEYSAIDALNLAKLTNLEGLQIGELLARLERYNGMGYQKLGRFSPYLWAGTDLYEKGKYVADGQFDPDVSSKQPGAAALLRRLQDRKIINLRDVPTASAQQHKDDQQ
jgi:lysozyme family protein